MTEAVMVRFIRGLARAAQSLGWTDRHGAVRIADALGFGRFVRRHRGELTAEVSARELMGRLSNRLLLDAAAEASRQLASLAIPHFFAKGAALLGEIYQLGDRDLADIDLYVHPASSRLAVQAIEELGYRRLPSEQQSGPARLRPGVVLSREAASAAQTVTMDVHWGLEPVDRLLPRADLLIPDVVWRHVSTRGDLPIPTTGHHAALVIYHLVHHDMLHVRGLVDVVFLWRDMGRKDARRLVDLATTIGVERALHAIGQVLVRDLGLRQLDGVGPPPRDWRGRQLTKLLVLHRWLAWAASASEREHEAITRRRIGRRILLLDEGWRVLRLFGDVIFPPRAHLRWRWHDAETDLIAWWCHIRNVARKAVVG